MNIPLHWKEKAFNTCELDYEVRLHRERLRPDESAAGHFVVWNVLGFVGKSNPLVFARAASFAARTAQGMLRPAPGAAGCQRAAPTRLQLYVDDPVATSAGTPAENTTAVDVMCFGGSSSVSRSRGRRAFRPRACTDGSGPTSPMSPPSSPAASPRTLRPHGARTGGRVRRHLRRDRLRLRPPRAHRLLPRHRPRGSPWSRRRTPSWRTSTPVLLLSPVAGGMRRITTWTSCSGSAAASPTSCRQPGLSSGCCGAQWRAAARQQPGPATKHRQAGAPLGGS